MPSPWTLDEEDIPEDPRVRARKRRLRLAGLGLWGLFFGSLSVLLVSDTATLTTTEIALLSSLSVGTATVVVAVCMLALALAQRLPGVGQIIFALIFLLFLAVAIPPLVSLAVEHAPGFEGISAETRQPLLDLLELLG